MNRDRWEQLGTITVLAVFVYVAVLHPARYGVRRFGGLWALGTVAALVAVYAWAWWYDTKERKTARREQVERCRAWANRAAPYDQDLDGELAQLLAESETNSPYGGKFEDDTD